MSVDANNTLACQTTDLSCTLGETHEETMDLIFMTTQSATTEDVRPYVWELINYLNNKILFMRSFCDTTAMDYKLLVARGLAMMQMVTFETLYELVPKCTDLIQLLFEFKFLSETLKTEDADQETQL